MADMRNNDELFQGVQMACAVCGDVERHCEPVCQCCLSAQELQQSGKHQRTELLQRLLEWARTFGPTWKDGSDAEVELEEILEEARALIPPEEE